MERISPDQLFDRLGDELELTDTTPGATPAWDIVSSDLSIPGLLLAGYDRGFRPDRVQVIGASELQYFESLDDEGCDLAVGRLCVPGVPCLLLTDGLEPPGCLVSRATALGIPVYSSALPRDILLRRLSSKLADLLAPSTTLHGTLVDVYGVGLLFTGKSGIGKSECGLDLVEHGHRLVADDVVHVFRTPQKHLIGSGNELLRHYMEIRGVGIIDVRSMFGIRAIRQRKRVEVEVKLVAWSDLDDYERLGIEESKTEILGVEIDQVILPLVTGKNITVISEVIALNHLLKLRGIHPAREFDAKLRDLAGRGSGGQDVTEGDSE
ncbi:MAG: HPr(Ser) kinase/phosphatase [Candidatus Eisenbacteria bacterium]|nr:HPr(Ser) kinase/phosphatase [Candidatus Eisenbacteria bacterium]